MARAFHLKPALSRADNQRRMIIHQLIGHYLKKQDDTAFYVIQAEDAVRWIESCGVALGPKSRVLDIGCGHGVFGDQFRKRGCDVVFSDVENLLAPHLAGSPFRAFNIDQEDISKLGEYDLVLCSNVYEHL